MMGPGTSGPGGGGSEHHNHGAAPPSMTGPGSGPSGGEAAAAYDPLAAMMAPPSRSIPKNNSFGQMPQAPSSGGRPPSVGMGFAMPKAAVKAPQQGVPGPGFPLTPTADTIVSPPMGADSFDNGHRGHKSPMSGGGIPPQPNSFNGQGGPTHPPMSNQDSSSQMAPPFPSTTGFGGAPPTGEQTVDMASPTNFGYPPPKF